MRRKTLRAGIAAVVAAVAMPGQLSAQSLSFGQNLPQMAETLPPRLEAAAPVQPRLAVPQAEELLGLIRSTVIALNQANQTGNYTVLRDLAAPDFRNGNDASRLGAIFQVLRDQAVDLTPLLQISPEVNEPPTITPQGLLRMTGYFPTQPLRVNFDLSFQYGERRWQPYTISVYLGRLAAKLEVPALTPQPKPNAPQFRTRK